MRISVCVAATRPDTVGATARSIAAQTHGDWELIVIVQGGAAPAVAEAVEREVPRSRARVLPQDGTWVRVDPSGTQTFANIATTLNTLLNTSYTAGSFHAQGSPDLAPYPGTASKDA